MRIAQIVVTLLAALMAGFSGVVLLMRAQWIVRALDDYAVPRAWWTPLGLAKAAGAAGLVTGLFVPVIGVLAGCGLVLYFLGAAITVARARYHSHIPFPLVYAAPVVGALVLGYLA
ncbi:DoxX family protein [Streptomyces sp. SID486]|uniref:DoxX family protein n=1 Tax=unclassified Streptomyces TaxID=2593676 RepID=UPI00136C5295|nr:MULTISPECIES: DoxX family protein [unclassified Streptomyces]MYW14807.1 DoxX family protein [Streptomyces sp. SID2955]MYW47707.1 DoxX family protein [Streptomyces sp. SID161]MYX97963.1 DoxX family protein [Streptomyces sp. SID486]